MRILKKEKEGTTVLIENLKDLWFLYKNLNNQIIEQKTLRTKTISKGGEIIKGKKIPQIIAIKIEKKKWICNKVRVTGKIVSEVDKNKHHSFNLEVDRPLKIRGEIGKLPKEEKHEILICLVDKKEADIRLYKSGKLIQIRKIQARGPEFCREVANFLNGEKRKILLAGPGNTKDKIFKLMEKKPKLENLSCSGEKGFKELLKREGIKRLIQKLREEQEAKTVSRFLLETKRNPEKVCYGSEVEKNLDRIKEIIILSSLIPKYENIILEAEKTGAEINIVNDEKEYCQELKNFELIGIFWW